MRLRLGFLVSVLAGTAGLSVVAAPQSPARPQSRPLFRTGVDLVSINVVVRDRAGNLVRGLTRGDFLVTEDGRPQTVSTFDFEELEARATAAPEAIPTVLGGVGGEAAASPPAAVAAPAVSLHGRRLIILLFDLTSLQPEEAKRAFDSARDYVENRLAPADAVAITTLSTSLLVPQDFTGDRSALLAAIDRLSGNDAAGFAEGAGTDAAADANASADTGFTADDTEFNVFNTDRRLEALQDAHRRRCRASSRRSRSSTSAAA